MDWISTSISVLALLLSGAAFWFTRSEYMEQYAPYLVAVLRPPTGVTYGTPDESWRFVLRNTGRADALNVVLVLVATPPGRTIREAVTAEHLPGKGETSIRVGDLNSPEHVLDMLMRAQDLGAISYLTPRGKKRVQKSLTLLRGDGLRAE